MPLSCWSWILLGFLAHSATNNTKSSSILGGFLFIYLILPFQNISNNHIGTEGAEAISRMFLDNISCLRAVQLSGGSMHSRKRAGEEFDMIFFTSITLLILKAHYRLWARFCSHVYVLWCKCRVTALKSRFTLIFIPR